MPMSQKDLIQHALEGAMDYPTYRDTVAAQAREGRTSGPEQTESLIHYTKLNHQRMKRWDRTFRLGEDLKVALDQGVEAIWLVFTETWCGDAAPILPIMEALASYCPGLSLKIAYRDQHLELMEHYRTDGALAIPKLLVLNREGTEVTDSWGPRPEPLMDQVRAFKAAHGKLTPEFRESLQRWYNKDKGQAAAAELAALLTLKDVGNGALL